MNLFFVYNLSIPYQYITIRHNAMLFYTPIDDSNAGYICETVLVDCMRRKPSKTIRERRYESVVVDCRTSITICESTNYIKYVNATFTYDE